MPELVKHSPENSEFARVVEVAQLRGQNGFPFEISPSDGEKAAIAKLLGAQGVRKMIFSGALQPLSKNGWLLDGKLGATVIQTCVVSLDPVTTRVDLTLSRKFLPQEAPLASDIVVAPEDDDVEPLGDTIDLGLVAIEALALALPAYPRKQGASLSVKEFAAEGVTPLQDSDLKPFAALSALKDKLRNDP